MRKIEVYKSRILSAPKAIKSLIVSDRSVQNKNLSAPEAIKSLIVSDRSVKKQESICRKSRKKSNSVR